MAPVPVVSQGARRRMAEDEVGRDFLLRLAADQQQQQKKCNPGKIDLKVAKKGHTGQGCHDQNAHKSILQPQGQGPERTAERTGRPAATEQRHGGGW